MRLKDYFTNTFDTSDNHYINELRTRYYRNRLSDAKNAVLDYVSSVKGKVLSDDEQYNELLYETAGYSMTVIFVPITPSEIAIDLKVNTFSLLPFGKGKKVIDDLYKYLDKNLQFKGVSLFRG